MDIKSEFEIEGNAVLRYYGDEERIDIPEGIKSIESYAFEDCQTLKSVTIPGSVVQIGAYAFLDCQNLESVTMAEGVIFIEDHAFDYCINLKEIIIPGSVLSIEKHAFRSCKKLENIFVGEKSHVFASVDGVLFSKDKRNLILYPAGKKDRSYKIPDGVEVIKNFAFSRSENLEFIDLPQSVKIIEYSAFNHCVNLRKIVLPDSITQIGTAAFFFCESLESISIPKAVKIMEENTFEFCSNLKTIYIPESVTNILYAFCECGSLENVIVSKESAFFKVIDGALLKHTQLILYPPAKKDKIYVIPGCVRTIRKAAFCGCLNLECVVVPESVTKLGHRSFAGNENMKDIYFLNKYCYIPKEMGFNNEIKIHGFKDSTAEIYAKKNNLKFEEIN